MKYFPSAQLQYRGGGEQGRPQTRGFQGSVVGNSFWDGFPTVATTAIPMAMFESLQIQNGLSGSLYGGQEPAGTFSYARKRPMKNYNAVWFDYITRGNLGVGWDTSDKFDYFGYRAVLFTTNGEREPANQETQRQLGSFALDFYPRDDLTFETNFSRYRHIMTGYYNGVRVASSAGVATGEIPAFSSVTTSSSERFMQTTTASGKFKYTPIEELFIEGGYQWQEAERARQATGQTGFVVPSAFLRAQGEFNTGFVKHNVVASAYGYQWKSSNTGAKMSDTKSVGLLYDVSVGRHFEAILSASNSWFKSYSNGAVEYDKSGISWAGSVIGKIIPETLSVYFTYADSLKEGTAQYYDPSIYAATHPLLGQTIIFSPYRSEQFEVGVKARLGEIDISAAAFQITRPTYYEAEDASGNSIFDKQGEQQNRGFELTLGGKIYRDLSVYGGFTFLDAKMHKSAKKAVEGKTMIAEPKFQANVLFDYTVPVINKLAVTANLHYTSSRYVDEMNTKSVDGYFTADLGVRYATTRWLGKQTTLRLNINNLFNEEYWVGMFAGSLDGEMKGVPTTIFRGYKRTLMLSGQVKF